MSLRRRDYSMLFSFLPYVVEMNNVAWRSLKLYAIIYLRPVVSAPRDDTSPWYVAVATGKNPVSNDDSPCCHWQKSRV